MGRWSRTIGVAVLLTVVLPIQEASPQTPSARIVKLVQLDFVFTPDPGRARLGDTFSWRNQTGQYHTSTDQGPLLLWDSGLMYYGDTFSFTPTVAATYPYFCTLHERFGMFGTLQVLGSASPPSGPVGTVFTIAVATDVAPDGMVYDIQRRDPGAGWEIWQRDVTDPSVAFDSTGVVPGTYGFRSRMRRASDNAATEYSPSTSIRVTAP